MTHEEGWRKIGQKGGSYVVATLFNVVTKETETLCVRDYDYSDCSRDNEYWYQQPIDEDAVREHARHVGMVYAGATVKVVKGRKIPVGTIAVVRETKRVYDRYGRFAAVYAVFTDGRQTNVDNCQLV